MSILAVGSIAYDTIKTPFASGRDVLGGSLTYFALAARYFSNVSIIGVVGTDFKKSDLDKFRRNKIDLTGLEIVKGQTFRWSGIYNYDLNNRKTLATELNVFQKFSPTVAPAHRKIKNLFLGNIDPDLQIRIIKQIKNPRLVVSDTMNYWIEKNRRALLEVLKQTDILIINESEARQLAAEANLSKAARVIVNKMEATKRAGQATIIIKQGEYGCLLFNRRGWFSLPALPLENVFDPTGAGDAFAGGFMGFLASQKKIDDKNLKQAAVYGTTMASFAVEKLGPANLIKLSKDKIKSRIQALKQITKI